MISRREAPLARYTRRSMTRRPVDAAAAARLMSTLREPDPSALGSALDELGLPAGARIQGRPLLQAALGFEGGEATADLLLARGARVDARDGGGWTALHHAAFSGRAATIRFLLARGADPRLTERGVGWNALHCLMAGAEREFRAGDASWWDELLVPLIAGGADPFGEERPPSRRLRREIGREIGKDLDVLPVRDPGTPLSLAARLESLAPLERLLASAGRGPTVAEASTALRAAVAAGRVEAVRLLASLGADATRAGADGETPVSLAVERKDPTLLRAVLEAGGDPRSPQGKRGSAPLLRAAHLGADAAVLEVLLAFGADVHARDRWGHSALSISLEAGRTDAIALLEAAGASEPPSLGIVVRPDPGDGVVVANVFRGSAGDDLDLRPDDRITAIDGRPVAVLSDLHEAIARRRRGDVARVEWVRGAERLSGSATLRHRRPVVLPDSPTHGFKFAR